VFDVDEVLQR